MLKSGEPRYIVVEGPIGVGKTTLARRLAESFGSDLLLEGAEENPFLERFYQDPRSAALQTQLFFLFQRAQQLKALRQGLRRRISERGRGYEKNMEADYLQRLSESYMQFFHNYNQAPLLIVNAAEIDFANNQRDYDLLLEQVRKIRSGRHYFNPAQFVL